MLGQRLNDMIVSTERHPDGARSGYGHTALRNEKILYISQSPPFFVVYQGERTVDTSI